MNGSSHHTDDGQLDQILARDALLVESLHHDESRRRRHWRLGALSAGCVMVLCLLGLTLTQVGLAASGDSLAAEGWSLWRARRFAEAEGKFAAAVEQSPNSVSAWNGLGWARLNQGRPEEALTAFEKCLELQPGVPAALNGAGQSLLSLKKYDEAKEILVKAAPQASAAWYGLARIELLQGNFDEAEKWAQKIVNLDPDNEMSTKMLEAAQAGELSADLRKLIEPPTPSQANTAKAWQLFNQGQGDAALKMFEDVLAISPDDLSAMNGYAFCLLNLGDVEKAKPYFEKILATEPKAFGPMNGLARCLKAQGDVEGAIELWSKLDEQVPGVDAGTAGLAETYLEQGEFEKAVQHFERLVEATPNNPHFNSRLQAARKGLKKSE